MAIVLGSGRHTYEVLDSWAQLPADWDLRDVAGVAVDAQDQVYVFNRGLRPMVVLDREGTVLRTWGAGEYPHAHGIFLAPDQTLYLTDDGNHTLTRTTLDGEVLLRIGVPGEPAPFHSGLPFNRCTHTALSPDGDIYVSDGYGNARIHRFRPDGTLVTSWGRNGMAAGEFNLPHNIVCDGEGRVYVADRENHRIQVFDGNGQVEQIWGDVHRPCALYRTVDGEFLVGELGPSMNFNRGAPNLGPRLSVLDSSGALITRLETTPAMGLGPGQFISPHGLAVDSHGDIYVAEVSVTGWPQLFPGEPTPARIRSLQKLRRVSG